MSPGAVSIGLDIGTTAVKAIAVDAKGSVIDRVRVAHSVQAESADRLSHDPAEAWRRGPKRAFAAIAKAVDRPISGVCVTAMIPSLAAFGPRALALTPGLLYGDSRGRLEGELKALGQNDDTLGDTESFLRWCAAEAPGALGYWPAQAVANQGLAGIPAIDTILASGFGRLHSRGKWDEKVLNSLGATAAQMPQVVPIGEPAGVIRGTKTVVAGGTIDAFCDQIVSGADDLDDVLVIFGATLIVWGVIPDWREIQGLWTVPHTTPDRILIGGPSNAGALFVDWARRLIGDRPEKHKVAQALPLRGGDPGRVPVWLPYVRGERVPFHDEDLRASLHGLDISHDATGLRRAAFETSGFVIRRMMDMAGVKPKRIVASGGGTKLMPWMAAVADATGIPVHCVAVPEGGAFGAAFIAKWCAGGATSLDEAREWARQGQVIEPDPIWAQAANDRYERFVALGPGDRA